MADTGDLKSPALTGVRVRPPPSAQALQDNPVGLFIYYEKWAVYRPLWFGLFTEARTEESSLCNPSPGRMRHVRSRRTYTVYTAPSTVLQFVPMLRFRAPGHPGSRSPVLDIGSFPAGLFTSKPLIPSARITNRSSSSSVMLLAFSISRSLDCSNTFSG